MAHMSNITVAVLPIRRLLEIKRTDGTLDYPEGIFLKEVLGALGFNYRLLVPEDKEFGRFINGSWTGLIGMVHRGEADLACNHLTITEQRMEAVDFSTPYRYSPITFGIGKTASEATKNAYIHPFHLSVWLCFLGCLILMSSLLWNFLKGRYSFGKLNLELIAHSLKQPLTVKCRNSFCVKTQLILWSYLSMVLGTCYTGTLLSYMTVPMKPKNIETFKELSEAVKKGTHRCFALKGSNQVPLLLSKDELYLQELGKAIDKNNWYFPVKNLYKAGRLIDQYTALILTWSDVDSYVQGSSAVTSKDSIAKVSAAIAVGRDFCCKRKLNQIISRLVGSGIIEKLNEFDAFKNRLTLSRYRNQEQMHPISIEDLSGILIFLVVGLCVSLLVLFGELLIYSKIKCF